MKSEKVVNDYGKFRFICPPCSKRYGPPDRLGWIDLKMCNDCEIRMDSLRRDPSKKKRSMYTN